MRLDVRKFLFLGLEEERAQFFARAQEFGLIHFIEKSKEQVRELPQEINTLMIAIKIVRSLPVMPQEELKDLKKANTLAEETLKLHISLEKLYEQLRLTQLEIARVEVFGDFSKEEISYIEQEGKRHIQFFFAKHGAVFTPPLPETVIYVGTEHELDYFVAISQTPLQHVKLVEMRIEQPLGMLKNSKTKLEKEIHQTEHEIKTYAKYETLFHHALIHQLDHYYLEKSQNAAQLAIDNKLFLIEGFVPENKIDKLQEINKTLHVHMEEIAIEPNDQVPTYLENQGVERLGEDLVNIYDTPSTTDKDPSLWVLVSFALFFAFIVGDGGYGLLFLAIALYIQYKHRPQTSAGKRVLKLTTILCSACIGWGLLTTSFFGIPFSYDSPIRKVSLIAWLTEKKMAYHIKSQDETFDYWVKKYPQLKEEKAPSAFVKHAAIEKEGQIQYDLLNKFTDNIMLELALFIGVVHTLFAMFRYLTRNLVFLGWILFIIGGYLYVPEYLQATSLIHYLFGLHKEEAAVVGLYLIGAGTALATGISLFKNKVVGIFEPMTAIQIFSDILSYLRLYALGMAGAIFTATINDSTTQVNFLIAIILLILGHSINMVLAVMGGIIHGLRLNFIEWYHYSFEGGGKKFKPLHKTQIE